LTLQPTHSELGRPSSTDLKPKSIRTERYRPTNAHAVRSMLERLTSQRWLLRARRRVEVEALELGDRSNRHRGDLTDLVSG